jgi:hypothetical protein
MADWATVRVAPEILAKLETEGSEPIHIIGIERHDDGTLDLTLRASDQTLEIRELQRQVDALAGGIRSFLTSLPFQPQEALGFQARVKLAGALEAAGLPPAGEQ